MKISLKGQASDIIVKIEFLKVSGLFDAFVEKCPLEYKRPNAPDKRDVMGTLILSILTGHKRYAHVAVRSLKYSNAWNSPSKSNA